MADEDDEVAGGPRSREHGGGVVGGRLDPDERPAAAGEIIVLNVDDDQSAIGHGLNPFGLG